MLDVEKDDVVDENIFEDEEREEVAVGWIWISVVVVEGI